jgi:hypothetical protein
MKICPPTQTFDICFRFWPKFTTLSRVSRVNTFGALTMCGALLILTIPFKVRLIPSVYRGGKWNPKRLSDLPLMWLECGLNESHKVAHIGSLILSVVMLKVIGLLRSRAWMVILRSWEMLYLESIKIFYWDSYLFLTVELLRRTSLVTFSLFGLLTCLFDVSSSHELPALCRSTMTSPEQSSH